jgi:hypothetical protein
MHYYPNNLLHSSPVIRVLSAAAPASPLIKLLFSIARLPRNGMTSASLPYAMY